MARTALSQIPSPDPDTFIELLVNDLHIPLDSTASMRRWLPGHLWTLAHQWLNAMDAKVLFRRPFLPCLDDIAQEADDPGAEEGCDGSQVAESATEDQSPPGSLPQAQPLTRAERLERRLQQKEKQQLKKGGRSNASGSEETQTPPSLPSLQPLAIPAASSTRHELGESPLTKRALASELITGTAPPSSRYRAPLNERNGRMASQDDSRVATLRFAPPKQVRSSSNLSSIQVVPPTSPHPPTSAPLSPKRTSPHAADGLSKSPARRPLKRVRVNELGEPVKRRLHIEPDDEFVLPFQFPANS